MHLNDVQHQHSQSPWGFAAEGMQAAGIEVPQILHLFNFKPDRTEHLSRYTHGVMRGPSPLPPGFRELIAAYTSKLNHCPF